jgi:prepilin-type N-terminal cleavage/methylation domain
MDTGKRGFTLIETVIGLAIVCGLIAVSVWNLKDYQARMKKKKD